MHASRCTPARVRVRSACQPLRSRQQSGEKVHAGRCDPGQGACLRPLLERRPEVARPGEDLDRSRGSGVAPRADPSIRAERPAVGASGCGGPLAVALVVSRQRPRGRVLRSKCLSSELPPPLSVGPARPSQARFILRVGVGPRRDPDPDAPLVHSRRGGETGPLTEADIRTLLRECSVLRPLARVGRMQALRSRAWRRPVARQSFRAVGLWSRCSFVRVQVRMAARPNGATPVRPVVCSAPPLTLAGPARAGVSIWLRTLGSFVAPRVGWSMVGVPLLSVVRSDRIGTCFRHTWRPAVFGDSWLLRPHHVVHAQRELLHARDRVGA